MGVFKLNVFNQPIALAKGSYSLTENNVKSWGYSAPMYAFKYQFDSGISTMFLPINPENLTITTNYATNLIPTLYSTVEEHSETRYFNISITGTTGIAPIGPKFPDQHNISDDMVITGRKSYSGAEIVVPVKNSPINRILASLSTNNNSIGVDPQQTGYIAFHNLYRFLMRYKTEAASNNKNRPLLFYNYKDNNAYRVSLQSFSMTRNQDDPFMYRYTIYMTGYSLETIDAVKDTIGTLADIATNISDFKNYSEQILSTASLAKKIYEYGKFGFDIIRGL